MNNKERYESPELEFIAKCGLAMNYFRWVNDEDDEFIPKVNIQDSHIDKRGQE